MKDSGVRVPVALNVFVRPDSLKMVFDVVRKARPYILFLIGDGPRKNVLSDVENIEKSRKIVEAVDWECEVYRLYSETNQGMYKSFSDAQKFIFQKVDRCIFLEDDVVVSQSFFTFCEEMLTKYENDLRVHYVTGMNYLGEYEKPDSDYFFAGEGAIWGYAIWKRTYLNQNMDFQNSNYITECVCNVAKQYKPGYEKKIRGYLKNPRYEGHLPGPEFYKNILRFSQNQLYIVPTKNMVCNIGIGNGASHSSDSLKKLPRATQKLFFAKTYEYVGPFKHPEYVVRDVFYEKQVNKILAWNKPMLKFFRNCEGIARIVFWGGFQEGKRKINKLFLKQYEN